MLSRYAWILFHSITSDFSQSLPNSELGWYEWAVIIADFIGCICTNELLQGCRSLTCGYGEFVEWDTPSRTNTETKTDAPAKVAGELSVRVAFVDSHPIQTRAGNPTPPMADCWLACSPARLSSSSRSNV